MKKIKMQNHVLVLVKEIREFVSVTGVIIMVGSIFLTNFIFLFKNTPAPFWKTITNLSADYDWKMEEQVGLFYRYTQFVNSSTPKNALILHPKMQSRWPEVSNEGYTRYFIYPRDLVAEDGDEDKKSKINYIFIIGRKTLDSKSKLDPWPTVKIPARRLIYFPLGMSGEIKILEKDYDPNDQINDQWGIIELKK